MSDIYLIYYNLLQTN